MKTLKILYGGNEHGAIESTFEKEIIDGIKQKLNEQLEHLAPNINDEGGHFIIRSSSENEIEIIPEGFSEELMKRITTALAK